MQLAGWILLKLGVQVSIQKWGIMGNAGIHLNAVVGRQGNLVILRHDGCSLILYIADDDM